jgi:hypothetical protein
MNPNGDMEKIERESETLPQRMLPNRRDRRLAARGLTIRTERIVSGPEKSFRIETEYEPRKNRPRCRKVKVGKS